MRRLTRGDRRDRVAILGVEVAQWVEHLTGLKDGQGFELGAILCDHHVWSKCMRGG